MIRILLILASLLAVDARTAPRSVIRAKPTVEAVRTTAVDMSAEEL